MGAGIFLAAAAVAANIIIENQIVVKDTMEVIQDILLKNHTSIVL